MREDVTDGDLVDVTGLDMRELLDEDGRSALARALERVLGQEAEAYGGFQSSM
jgi:FXSXX-COOH protein